LESSPGSKLEDPDWLVDAKVGTIFNP